MVEAQRPLHAGVVDIALAAILLQVDVDSDNHLIGQAKQFGVEIELHAPSVTETFVFGHPVVSHEWNVGTDWQEGKKVTPHVIVAHRHRVSVADFAAID